MAKRAWIPVIMVLLLAFFAQRLINPAGEQAKKQVFSDFQTQLAQGKVDKVTMVTRDSALEVTLNKSFPKNERNYTTGYPGPEFANQLIDQLNKKSVQIEIKPNRNSLLGSLLPTIVIMVLLLAFWIFILGRMQGGGGSRVMSFGKSRA